MKLTRRDAILAIVGGGLIGHEIHRIEAAGANESAELGDHEIATLVSVAEVVYPSAVDATPGFVSAYVRRLGRARRSEIRTSIGELDDRARSMYGTAFQSATPGERRALLHRLGVDAVQPRPEGTVAERVRYHVVNGLLYALFTSPKGSRLVGIEEPKGHPGGFAAYRTGGSE